VAFLEMRFRFRARLEATGIQNAVTAKRRFDVRS